MTTTVTAVASTAQTDPQIETNREMAIDFLTRASRGQARDAMERHVSTDFVHHNPFFAGDATSLAAAMDDNARANPAKTLEILRSVAEGPFVAVHSRVQLKPDEPSNALVHLFRIEGGRICELWDVAQPVPKEMANQAGMF